MDIHELKVGTEGTFFPPFEGGINALKKVAARGYDSLWFADHLMAWIPESIWNPKIIDAAAFIETYCQSAIMYGYRAAKVILKHLETGEGFKEYTDFWKSSFEFLPSLKKECR